MNRKILALALALLLCALTAVAVAQTATGVAYGTYSMEGEHADSLIRITLTCEDGAVTAAQIDEKLIPATAGGTPGWAVLSEETAALLGDAVIDANGTKYPASFALDGVTFTGAADENYAVAYTGAVNGADVALMDYIFTDEGGAWYFACEQAELLDATGACVATTEIGTKESIGHGVAFWPGEIKYPGNIERICAFLVANGVDYAMEDVAMGEDGAWAVADATTGATLSGMPNYLLIAKRAFDNAK